MAGGRSDGDAIETAGPFPARSYYLDLCHLPPAPFPTMEPVALIAIFVAAAAVLTFAELLLPTHGLLGLLAAVAGAGAIGTCFYVDRWLGLGAFAAAVVAAPFVATAVMRAWERSPVGRHVVLGRTVGVPVDADVAVGVGEVGTAVTALRPMGECEFPAAAGPHPEANGAGYVAAGSAGPTRGLERPVGHPRRAVRERARPPARRVSAVRVVVVRQTDWRPCGRSGRRRVRSG